MQGSATCPPWRRNEVQGNVEVCLGACPGGETKDEVIMDPLF